VPLDGSRAAEAILPYAAELCHLFGSTLVLFRVTRHPARGADSVPGAAVNESGVHLSAEGVAAAYLETVATRWRASGVRVVTSVLAARSVADALVEEARLVGAGLIAMSTHGQTGLKRLVMGSVTASVLQRSGLPLLVLRPRELR
jgi:nucleotide-binding universal stress UspA family protein